jgi:hypothetical protein
MRIALSVLVCVMAGACERGSKQMPVKHDPPALTDPIALARVEHEQRGKLSARSSASPRAGTRG